MARTPKQAEKFRVWMRSYTKRRYATEPAYRERVRSRQNAADKRRRALETPEVKAARRAKRAALAKEALKKPTRWKVTRIGQIRARCQADGIPFAITAEDLAIPEFCPVLGLRLRLGAGLHAPDGPSVDRIRPHLGYVVGNVRVISYRANLLKSNATLNELAMVYADACSIAGGV